MAKPYTAMPELEKQEAQWYVVHTYSGYENKVKANLEKIIENRGLQDLILDVRVPMREEIEVKDGVKRSVMRKVYPGYVVVRMVMTDETWYIVRNTRGVTGFVGPGSKPIPLSDQEIEKMGIDIVSVHIDFGVGDSVKVISGPLESFIGKIEDIDYDKQKARVAVSMFGRNTPVELDFVQLEKL